MKQNIAIIMGNLTVFQSKARRGAPSSLEHKTCTHLAAFPPGLRNLTDLPAETIHCLPLSPTTPQPQPTGLILHLGKPLLSSSSFRPPSLKGLIAQIKKST